MEEIYPSKRNWLLIVNSFLAMIKLTTYRMLKYHGEDLEKKDDCQENVIVQKN